ncbi:MAG: S8 family serine peptidase [Candidatus Thorarchaeota archaeon]
MRRKRISSKALIPKPIALVSATMMLLMISIFGNLPHVQGFTPNDPVGNPWHLDAINIHSVWDHGYSFYSPESIGLCVIGEEIINDQNGDLEMTEKASFAWNSDYSAYLTYPSFSTGSHGAAVASVAASTINNSIGVAGIVNAPLYSAWPWGNYPDDDTEMYNIYVQQMIDIFDWGSSFGRIVFTMSFINTVYDLDYDDPTLVELQDKVTELYESGDALFFAAAGNTLFPLHPKDVPQSLPFVRVIGRIDSSGSYNDGGYGEQVFLVAPFGVPAYMQATNTYGAFGGASCSCPIVAASAVLLWNQFPWASNAQIEDALCWGATDILESGWDEKSGYGALNVEKAREYLAENVPSANSYRLNWTTMSETTPSDGSNTSASSSAEISPTIYVSLSIPIIASIIVLIVVTKKKRDLP